MIKNKFKELLCELKKFKVQIIFVLEHLRRNDCKIFHSSAKIIASDSDTDEAFKSMHQSIMTKIKNYAREDCIVLDVILIFFFFFFFFCCYFFISIRSFFLFLCFSIYTNAYSKYCQSISLKTYKRIRFSKKNSLYSMEHLKKKGLLLLANKLVEKILILAMLKNTINHLLEKTPQN